jgi:hypothetical protein
MVQLTKTMVFFIKKIRNKAKYLPFSLIKEKFLEVLQTMFDQSQAKKIKAYSCGITSLTALAPARLHKATSSLIL